MEGIGRMSRRIKNLLFIILISAFILMLGVMLWSEKMEQEKYHEMELQRQHLEMIKPTDDNSIRLIDKTNYSGQAALSEGTIIVDFDEFRSKASRTSYLDTRGATVNFKLSNSSNEWGGCYLISFQMRATEKNTAVSFRAGTVVEDLYLSTQWQEFCFPLKHINDLRICFSMEGDFQVLEMSNFEIRGFSNDTDMSTLPCGYYLLEDVEEVQLQENDYGIGRTSDFLVDNEYMYTVGGNKFTIASIENNSSPKVISTLSGIGNGRRIKQVNEDVVAVAARQNGVYFINISNKNSPYLIGRYNSLDTANDICISGNLMIVVNRYYGIEFVDISNLDSPQYISQISNNKECYRCTIDNQYLYVSCWATRDVEIYDITDVNTPQLLSDVEIDGRCGEATIENGLLYVASGFNAKDNSAEVGEFGYGTGNGLTIYDVSNPLKPILLSVVKCDGSLFASGYDDWSVRVKNGYAYFTSAYDGVYIYDVSDADNPIRVKHVTVPLYKGTDDYEDMTVNSNYVFPYDESMYLNAGNWALELGDGVIYFGAGNSSIAVYPFEKAERVDYSEGKGWSLTRKSVNNNDKYQILLDGYDVTSVAINEDEKLYVGTSKGIVCLSSDMEVLSVYETEEAVKDIKYNNGYLYTAEFNRVAIYKASDDGITFISEYKDFWDDCCVSAVEVTTDNNYLVLQAYWSRAVVLDIHDKETPKFVQTIDSATSEYSSTFSVTPGSMYGRNLTNSVDNIVGVYGSSSICWLKSVGDSIEMERMYRNSIYGELSGIAILSDNQAVGVAKGGMVLFDFQNITGSALGNLEAIKIPDFYLSGKIAICDNLAILSNMVSGDIWMLNISNVSNPRLSKRFQIQGNPQIACRAGGSVLIPARNGGLICAKVD